MNRALLALALIVVLAPSAIAQHFCDHSMPEIDCETCAKSNGGESCAKYFGSVDYLYWKARRAGLDYAIADSDTDNNIEGPLESLELKSTSGVRTTLGYITPSHWEISFTYTQYDSEVGRLLNAVGGGQLWLTRTNPASFNNVAATATALASLEYDVFDLEAGYWFGSDDSASLRIFGGLRGAKTKQTMDVTYAGGTITGTRRQFQQTEMDGFGLRIGGEAHWSYRGVFGAFGRLAGTVMVGDFQTQYLESEPAINTGNVNTTASYFEAVPALEAAVGLNLQVGNFAMQSGYELTSWLNLGQRTNYTGASTIGRGDLTATSQDLVLDGLFLRFIYTR